MKMGKTGRKRRRNPAMKNDKIEEKKVGKRWTNEEKKSKMKPTIKDDKIEERKDFTEESG